MKYRSNWCERCVDYIPKRGASSHKCRRKDVVLIGESKMKCPRYQSKVKGFGMGEVQW